jgi:hypothetical protein
MRVRVAEWLLAVAVSSLSIHAATVSLTNDFSLNTSNFPEPAPLLVTGLCYLALAVAARKHNRNS